MLAKGGGVALKIQNWAAQPCRCEAPLARALYKHAELDQEIPAALYNAVAEVLAYVYQLANWRAQGGDYPSMPRNLPVPPELVPEGA